MARRRQQRAALPGSHADSHDLAGDVSGRVPDRPASHGQRSVRCQLEVSVVKRPARIRGEIARLGGRPAAVRGRVRTGLGDPRRLQPQAVRAKVVIPVPHRPGLVQDRCYPGVLPRLAACRVFRRTVAAGQRGRGEDRRSGGTGGGQARYAARRSGDPAGLAAAGGQQPERRLVRGAVRVGRLPGGWARALGGEQQRAVGQELRLALAFRAAGEPDRRAPGTGRAGIDPPDAADEFLAVGVHGRRGRGQPGTVRRQPQRGQPGDGDEVAQVAEWRHGPLRWLGRMRNIPAYAEHTVRSRRPGRATWR